MPSNLPDELVQQLLQEERHFVSAPEAFFQAWRQAVRIAGPQWFGDGTRDGLTQAQDKWALCPNVRMIGNALGVLSSGERLFLAALVSFYNAHHGAVLLKRSGFEGLADLSGLDLERRRVIAALILNHTGW
ncbi:Uncharacterised protein [Delftia tsuruhatensis]|uniref:hypothetical protein n=1 Tax=Delftia tsuruhatensis TaxID=180282 RepID=UPI001E6D16F5|nr:hypothetical protein [Delftia tsuruhatensis]CAB5670224.1 Uncharacterised protein [Delftia tsuruhatensis]CAC9682970.1 Uncharacterised protein [Delftia tsuruhatensis]